MRSDCTRKRNARNINKVQHSNDTKLLNNQTDTTQFNSYTNTVSCAQDCAEASKPNALVQGKRENSHTALEISKRTCAGMDRKHTEAGAII